MRIAVVLLLTLSFFPPAVHAQRGKKNKKEEVTQTLEVIPDPPSAVITEVSRVEYIVSPYSSKGLLSQQVRDGLKALKTLAGGRPIIKIRAFVAGTGDQRRVQSIVSETFAEKRQPIPAIATILVGLIPQEGVQVVMEAVVIGKKPANPNGLVFLSGMGGESKEPPETVLPMLDKAIADLTQAAKLASADPADFMRVTCLLSSVDKVADIRIRLATAFPGAVLTTVQALRGHDRALAECEAVARVRNKPASQLEFLNPPEMNPSPAYSKAAVVGPGSVIFTGSQLAFHNTDKDVHLAFQRMSRVLETAKSSMKHVAFSGIYSLSNSITAKVRATRFDYYDKNRPPASTLLLFEGLPSIDASFALELVAVPVQ